MTPFQKIIQSVAPIKAYADHNPKWETEKEYVVFNIADDRGAHGDDNPTENVTAFQIHWYFPQEELPEHYEKYKKKAYGKRVCRPYSTLRKDTNSPT